MVIVITGPIASGKSTVALELARELERTQVRLAVIDLDLVYDSITPDKAASGDAWALARHEAAAQANAFVDEGVTVVLVEGSFNAPDDRSAFTRRLDPSASPIHVTLQVSYDEALRRAEGDPNRGRSRDPAFLGPYFEAVEQTLATVPASDLVIDTEQIPPVAAAAAIARRIRTETAN